MKYSRRDFVKLGSFAVGLLPALAGRGFAQVAPDAFSLLNFDPLQKLIGTEFTIYRADSTSSAILTEVEGYAATGGKTDGKCFSLVFDMPSDDFAQENYEMFHPSIGKFELFSVPGRSEKEKPLLIAVINRL